MKRVVFTLHIVGYGKTIEEAWEDAVESFNDDPGSPYDEPFVEEEEDEEGQE